VNVRNLFHLKMVKIKKSKSNGHVPVKSFDEFLATLSDDESDEEEVENRVKKAKKVKNGHPKATKKV